MTDTKTCEHCGQDYARTKTTTPARFATRRYCSHGCAIAARNTYRGIELRAYVIGEVRHLLGTDSAANIATRLGYSHPRHLARMLGRWGENELAARIDRETRAEAA